MKKVKLLLQDLQVESFEVDPDSQGMGTVLGLQNEAQPGTVHTGCLTHCPTGGCEACDSVVATHCDVQCPSWNGTCNEFTCNNYTCHLWEYTCGWCPGQPMTIDP